MIYESPFTYNKKLSWPWDVLITQIQCIPLKTSLQTKEFEYVMRLRKQLRNTDTKT